MPARRHPAVPAPVEPDYALMANTLYSWLHETELPDDLAEQVDALMIATAIHLMAQVTT
jgi:hypothetical protein